VFVKSPPSDRADEPFDPEVPKPIRFLEKNRNKVPPLWHYPKSVYGSQSKLYSYQL
jgi:hypothetical protein